MQGRRCAREERIGQKDKTLKRKNKVLNQAQKLVFRSDSKAI
jgi:hypothetical protein